MIDFWNELMASFKKFVYVLFYKCEFYDGITIGWLLVAIAVIALVINRLKGRL